MAGCMDGWLHGWLAAWMSVCMYVFVYVHVVVVCGSTDVMDGGNRNRNTKSGQHDSTRHVIHRHSPHHAHIMEDMSCLKRDGMSCLSMFFISCDVM